MDCRVRGTATRAARGGLRFGRGSYRTNTAVARRNLFGAHRAADKRRAVTVGGHRMTSVALAIAYPLWLRARWTLISVAAVLAALAGGVQLFPGAAEIV